MSPPGGRPLADRYRPAELEGEAYRRWEQAGYFAPRGKGQSFCIVIPPPNVTGSLHMGHAFQDTVMDALTRYHRMRGDCTLWQPGVDHAGIATQMVVERQLEAEGLNRRDLGREEFIRRVWAWKESSGGRISAQLRRLGASLDFSRDCFTLDEARSRAVTEVFVRLHEEGLIYRGQRLVNWDPVLQTALSDLEVVSSEENGHLWRLRYPLVNGQGAVEVDTTRPETMLGDTGVAVHPNDERYSGLVGLSVRLPLVGREIPIVADEAVDPEFGTGCVKVTPAHDFTDYEIGRRHKLPAINLLTPRAALNDAAPRAFAGLDRFAARKAVVEALRNQGVLVEVREHRHTVPRGDRSQAILEPFLTDQWFVRAKPLAEPAIAAVEDGRVRFVPENWSATYFEWMRNIEDWCISRQLWWGHQIPAWYGGDGEIFVGRNEAEVRRQHNLANDFPLRRDEDVLDTWFSSALWPFSTLGWPAETPELKRFYPGTVLVTGFDILFFWVARMIMMGLKFMGDVPFREVYVHGLIRDHQGQKMSKSKGNVIDPLDLIDGVELETLVEKRTAGLMQPQLTPQIAASTRKQFPEGIPAFGADAVRFSFAAMASTGQDIRYDLDRTAGYRNFCTKLWNAARFVFMQQPGTDAIPPGTDAIPPGNEGILPSNPPHPGNEGVPPSNPTPAQNPNATAGTSKKTTLPDRWILSRLGKALAVTRQGLDDYRLDLASRAMYDFVWREYCDWYLELSKIVLAGEDQGAAASARRTLAQVLEVALRALHPIMPFITEALWQRAAPLAGVGGESVMIATWPQAEDYPQDTMAEADIEWLQGFVLGIRQIRGELNLPPGRPLEVLAQGASASDRARIESLADLLYPLAGISELKLLAADAEPPPAAAALHGELRLLTPLAGVIDPAAESARLAKLLKQAEKALQAADNKLSNPQFLSRAPDEVVQAARDRQTALQRDLERLREQTERIKALDP